MTTMTVEKAPDEKAPETALVATGEKYGIGPALARGDGLTKTSVLVWGLGNLARGQVLKGLIFLAVEVGFLAWLVTQGWRALAALPGLAADQEQISRQIDGYWYYENPEPSVTVLLNGIGSLFIIALAIWYATVSLRSAYKAQRYTEVRGSARTLKEDLHALTDTEAHQSMMTLPTAGLLIFTILPLIFMISMAFTSYDSNNSQQFEWVGLKNFGTVFSGSGGAVNAGLFVQVLIWTLVWAFFATFLNFFLGTFLAIIINRKATRWKGMWRALFSLSIAVPQFVSLLVIRTMLQPTGAVNRLLIDWGLIDSALPFFTDAMWARVTVIVVNLWVGIPFTIMQVTGILQNIPGELYEAASLDGAGVWRKFRSITMPYMLFVLTPYLITTFTANVNNFNVIYLLSGGDPTPVGASAGKTDLLITWLYKLTVDRGDYNLGAVIGILTFIVLAAVALVTYRSSGSYRNEEAMQ